MAQEYSQHQTDPHPAADADSDRPLFKAHNPATGQLLRTYRGHTREEALAIAVALREAVEQGKTAALVTPDRALGRRVHAALASCGIFVSKNCCARRVKPAQERRAAKHRRSP